MRARVDLRELRSLASFGLPGYFITRSGRVVSVRVLKPSIRKDGHPRLKPQVDGRTCDVLVARLVARVFHGRPPRGLPLVGYRDGNRRNVAAANLFYCASDARGSRQGRAKLDERKVSSILRALARGVSSKALAKRFAVSPETISGIRRRRTWRHVPA